MDFKHFGKRFKFVLQGQTANPWAKTVGLSTGTVTRMSHDNVPGQDVLTAIMRKENVNLSWLLSGRGQPFMVDTHLLVSSCISQIKLHLADTAEYSVYWMSSEELNLSCVVFAQPAGYQFKDTFVQYYQIEILCSHYSEDIETLMRSLKQDKAASVKHVILAETQLRALVGGQLGTYSLLGDEKGCGLLNDVDRHVD